MMNNLQTLNLLFRHKAMLCAALLAISAAHSHAQSVCTSDGQPRPAQLMERFINADCETCWTDPATPTARTGVIALDWVVPGSLGDEAALSAVAIRDAQWRLEALGDAAPAASSMRTQPIKGIRGSRLRVAHGLALNDYVGASIELKPIPAAAKNQEWTSWLALVETLPPGTEGSPVERNLVRNVFQTPWDGRKQLSKKELNQFIETRAMTIAPAVNPNRLRVVGWVEDEKGQLLAAAQSRCIAP